MYRLGLLLLLLMFGLQSAVSAEEDPMAPVADKPGLPRVLLIGDSISIGYTLPVRALLEGKANVHRVPVNASSTLRGLEMLDDWLGDARWDVIHFNWGLHDMKHEKDGKADPSLPCMVPLADYEKNLETLVQRLEKTGAKLIWASTTVVPPGEPRRVTAEQPAYLEAAARVMQKHHIPIDDLYTVSTTECASMRIAPDNVHFTPEGSQRLARHVADHILKALKTPPAPAGK